MKEQIARIPVLLLFAGSLVLTVLTAAFAVEPVIEDAHPLTFDVFYQKVLEYYPQLKKQEANVNLAIARKLQAFSGFLPRIQGSFSVSRGDDPVFIFGSLLREESFTQNNFELSRLNTPRPHTVYTFSVEGQAPLFDAFQTISRVRSAKLQIDSARYEEAFTRMEAYLVASEAYLRAIAIEKLLAVVTQVSNSSEEDIAQADELKEKGMILGADFYAAKVLQGSISRFRNQLSQEKQAAHIVLNVLMGEDPFHPFEILGSATEPSGSRDKALQDWFDEAYRNRPDLAALDRLTQAQDIEVSREKYSMLPRVDAFGEARDDTQHLSSGGGQNYIVGVKARMDIFDPSYSSRVRGSKETLQKLVYDRTLLKDTITKDVANEFAHYRTTRDNLPVMRQMLEDARQAVELMRPLYREGKKSIVDLLQIRFSYVNVAKEYYTVLTDSTASRTRLLFLSGQLDEAKLRDVVTASGK